MRRDEKRKTRRSMGMDLRAGRARATRFSSSSGREGCNKRDRGPGDGDQRFSGMFSE